MSDFPFEELLDELDSWVLEVSEDLFITGLSGSQQRFPLHNPVGRSLSDLLTADHQPDTKYDALLAELERSGKVRSVRFHHWVDDNTRHYTLDLVSRKSGYLALVAENTVYENSLLRQAAASNSLDAAILDNTQIHQLVEKRFRDFAVAGSDWFWEMDEHLRFSYVSENIENVTGVSPERAIGLTRKDLLGKDYDLELWRSHLAILEAHQPFQNFEYFMYILNKASPKYPGVWVQISGIPVFNANGQFTGYRGTGKDISAVREAETAATKLEHRLSTFLDASSEIIYVADRVGTIKYINATAESLLQIKREDLIGDNQHTYIHAEDRPHVAEVCFGAPKNGVTFEVTYRVPRKDGSVLLLECTGSWVMLDDELELVGSVRDITEKNRLEEQLFQGQKLEAVGQLTGGIAHDFNNILAIILGNLELLEPQLEQHHEAWPRFMTIKKSTQRAADLTRQLLSFSRRQAVQVASADINQLTSDMEALITRSVTPEVEVEIHPATDLWHTAIDRGDFEDALLNLILNARDAMPGGGRLILETHNCTIDKAQNPRVKPGEYVQLVVRDTGQGIPPEQQEHIFEPFFSTKEQGKGTGLGLAMVFGFVERSGGHVEVQSQSGIGTTFQLYLPRSPGQGQPAQAPSEQPEILPGGSETILVVDDEHDLLNLAQESLQTQGYRVLIADDARGALDLLIEEPAIDMLFSDLVMPGGIDGYELAAQATAERPELKVLLTSGYTEKVAPPDDQVRSAVSLLKKPYTQAELTRRVRLVLGSG